MALTPEVLEMIRNYKAGIVKAERERQEGLSPRPDRWQPSRRPTIESAPAGSR
jgi:hypothetical protein